LDPPNEQSPLQRGSGVGPAEGSRGAADVAIEALRTFRHVFDRLVDDVFGNDKKFGHFKALLHLMIFTLMAIGAIIWGVLEWRGIHSVLSDPAKLLPAGGFAAGTGAVLYVIRKIKKWLPVFFARRRADRSQLVPARPPGDPPAAIRRDHSRRNRRHGKNGKNQRKSRK
jgi:hypothetical protein